MLALDACPWLLSFIAMGLKQGRTSGQRMHGGAEELSTESGEQRPEEAKGP